MFPNPEFPFFVFLIMSEWHLSDTRDMFFKRIVKGEACTSQWTRSRCAHALSRPKCANADDSRRPRSSKTTICHCRLSLYCCLTTTKSIQHHSRHPKPTHHQNGPSTWRICPSPAYCRARRKARAHSSAAIRFDCCSPSPTGGGTCPSCSPGRWFPGTRSVRTDGIDSCVSTCFAPPDAFNEHSTEHSTNIPQRCRRRFFNRPRSRRLVQRRLVRPRRGLAPNHRIRTSTPDRSHRTVRLIGWPMRERRQHFPQVHG
jgi:hypothetical protein